MVITAIGLGAATELDRSPFWLFLAVCSGSELLDVDLLVVEADNLSGSALTGCLLPFDNGAAAPSR